MLNSLISKKRRDRRRIWRLLESYPRYNPPFSGLFSRNEAYENFDYFVNVRSKRVKILANFFINFDFTLDFDDVSIDFLGSWLFFSGKNLLTLETDNTLAAITSYNPRWSGKFSGLNLINDIGIFTGEFIILKNSAVHWGLFDGKSNSDRDNIAYLLPSLIGITEPFYAPRKAVYMTDEILRACYGSRDCAKEKLPQHMQNRPLWFGPTDYRRVFEGMANIKPMGTYLG